MAVFGLCLVLLARPGFACSMVQTSFEQREAAAKTIFVGTVRTVENGAAYFHVEKGVKGIADNADFDVDEMLNTCGISFAAGQRWLYMGNSAASGSLMLVSETGVSMDDNIAYVKKHFGEKVLAVKDDVVGGTAKATCAPWDGAAFEIKLDTGCTVTVYAQLGEDSAGKSYPIDGVMRAGHGMTLCGVARLKPDIIKGTLTLGHVGADEVTGLLETEYDTEHHGRTVFKVRRLPGGAICG
ncbi:MAG: hypothetical protein GC185_08215 [Alphaproteobacteria bacterium]|nr:hypothetical protein [Alphaproteobacteria bacterium]